MPMQVKVNESWPVTAMDAVRRKDLEIIKGYVPDYIKRMGIKITPSTSSIQAFTLFEVKKGREIKGIREIENLFHRFSSIHGFTYWLECDMCGNDKPPEL